MWKTNWRHCYISTASPQLKYSIKSSFRLTINNRFSAPEKFMQIYFTTDRCNIIMIIIIMNHWGGELGKRTSEWQSNFIRKFCPGIDLHKNITFLTFTHHLMIQWSHRHFYFFSASQISRTDRAWLHFRCDEWDVGPSIFEEPKSFAQI